MSKDKEARPVDPVTGTETTGHEWDGITELNTPLPKWWLNIFYATILGSIVYWVLFPAWPLLNSSTPGVLGHSDRANVENDLAALAAFRKTGFDRLAATKLEDVAKDPELFEFTRAAGASAFGINCAPCHGAGAQGAKGYPNLNDDEWIWGGTVSEIRQTIAFGVRNGDANARSGQIMMAYGGPDGVLNPAQIADTVEYVRKLSGQEHNAEAATRGFEVFRENCIACHNSDAGANPDDLSLYGTGNLEFGTPPLANNIWLYGGDRATLTETITKGRQGVMPVWHDKLDEASISALAVYVHSLGGGK